MYIRTVLIISIFLLMQHVPNSFAGNNPQLSTAKNLIAEKKVAAKETSPQAAKPAAESPKAAASKAVADFLIDTKPISKPEGAVTVQVATSTSTKKSDKLVAALGEKAEKQTKVPQQAAQAIVNDVRNVLTPTDPQQKKENLKELKLDVREALAEVVPALKNKPTTFAPVLGERNYGFVHYGQTEAANGVLLLPEGHSAESEPAPVVIMIHGGGFTGGSLASLGQESVYLAQNGYAVLDINYTLNHIDQALQDTKDAIEWVEENANAYNLDADNIGVVGGSAGASLAVMAGIQASDQVDCVVAFSPAVDNTPAQYNSNMAAVAPTYTGPMSLGSVTPGTSPTLVFTGENDLDGFQQPAVAFGEELQSNGVQGGTLVVPGGHGESLMAPNRDPALQFLDSNLKDGKQQADSVSKQKKPARVDPSKKEARKRK
jgi:acetyl esterase/lipase